MDTQTDFKNNLLQLPLLWLSLAFLLGIVLSNYLPAVPVFLLPAAIGILTLAVFLFRSQPSGSARVLIFAGILLCIGILRHQAAQPVFTAADLAFHNDSQRYVTVRGTLARAAIYRDAYVELWVNATQLTVGDQVHTVSGLLVARADLGHSWVYGEGVELYGRLLTPRDDADFSYRSYLARQGAYSEMPFASAEPTAQRGGTWLGHALYAIRQHGVATLHRLYADPVASLLAGILLGDETGISPSLKTAFNDTATRHIVAISGFNISIIAGLALSLASRHFGVRRGVWIAAGCVIGYTVLVGAQASVVRAAIMGLVVLGSQLAGRDQHSLNTLAFTAALMALINPLVLWDVGFQLSFTATLGLVVMAEPMQHAAASALEARLPTAWAARLKGPLSEYVLLTLAAQIFTLPLLLYHFGRLSLIALPANILILPLQPAILIFGGLSLLLGMLLTGLGQLFALLAWLLASLTISIVEWLSSPSWAAFSVGAFSFPWVLAYYAVLAALLIAPLRNAIRGLRVQPAVPALVLAACALGAWGLASSAPTGRLQLTLLNVEGEALLVRTPTGRNLLINGGPSAVELSAQLGRHLPPFAREIDWLFVLGQRPEQINGLRSGLERLNVANIAWANDWPTDDFSSLLASFQEGGYEPVLLRVGQEVDLGGGASMQVVSISSRGASVLLSWQNFQALLPVGIDASQVAWLQENPIPGLELLLLTDAGYRPLNPPAWLEAMDAELYWLTQDGEIDADVQAVFAHRLLLPASTLGWLQVETDGHAMWVSSQYDWP